MEPRGRMGNRWGRGRRAFACARRIAFGGHLINHEIHEAHERRDGGEDSGWVGLKG